MYYEISCPRCGANAVVSHNYARKVGAVIGAIAGAATGVSGNKGGSPLALIAGTLLTVLLGATAGCSTGSILGSAIDENVLNNFECAHCGSKFSRPQDTVTRATMPDVWQAE